jgi:hypothetical protein
MMIPSRSTDGRSPFARACLLAAAVVFASPVGLAGTWSRLGAQEAAPPVVSSTADTVALPRGGIPLGSYAEDRWRLAQLLGQSASHGFLLRSLSSTLPALPGDTTALRWELVGPYRTVVYNTALPFTLNDGALWAGRGVNALVRGGLRAQWGRVHLVLAPELVASANRDYPTVTRFLRGADTLIVPPHQYADTNDFPPIPGRSPVASPFHAFQSIDLPIRMGEEPITRLYPGQSAIWVDVDRFSIGAGTENGWWGPALHNPLLLSNTAPGFPHVFVRTARPWLTPAGAVEGRWIVGSLAESDHFDFDSRNDWRSISMLALTWQPVWHPALTVGVARAVFAAARDEWSALRDFYQVFSDVGMPNDFDARSPSVVRGRDQLASVFFRWVLPRDGAEVYGEWGRYEQPRNLLELLEEPNHSQGYTLGLQWIGDPMWRSARMRVQTEFTFLQQDASFRHRYTGSWYTSRAAVQGYTSEGQMLGAGIGPGSSSQWIAVDYVAPRWFGGLSFQRVRWLEDVHAQRWWGERRGFCEHDVSILPGARAGAQTRWGTIMAQFSQGWRVNTFFENHASGCPQNAGRNHWNKSLTLSIAPAVPR